MFHIKLVCLSKSSLCEFKDVLTQEKSLWVSEQSVYANALSKMLACSSYLLSIYYVPTTMLSMFHRLSKILTTFLRDR